VPGGHQKYFGKTQQSKLVKTRRDSAEVHAECSVCVFVIDGKDHDQQHNDDRMARSEAKFHFGYQKQRLHFRVPDTGSWRSQESRLFITGVPKCRNAKRRKSQTGTSTRVSGYRELEESRVETLHHRSPEVPKCETPKILKQAHQPEFRIPGVGGVKSRDSSSQESRSAEMRNAENPETGTSTRVSDTGSWRSQESRLFITGVPKCRNAKRRKS
jgi:hypothetical protein